ncbi:MAG: hydantoinase/oxoprolinase family protein [Pseudomonadota bacterium]
MDIIPKMGEDWTVGVDIGGTFIDFCALETHSGRMATLKVLTTPDDPGAELATGLNLLSQNHHVDLSAISRFVHGTTVGINTILQRKGAKLALITNAGFQDVIELARLRMPDMYSLFCHRADPLIPRNRIFGITARLNAEGQELQPPKLDEVTDIARRITATGCDGVIVALLHSWRVPDHEQAVKSMLTDAAPNLFAFTSAEVWPVIREYERFSTAILNGYVHPRVSNYLTGLETRLADHQVPAKALLTKSNGGVMSAADGRRNCVSMLLSGTASGVTGAAWVGEQAGIEKVLTLDIGGTSADIALIINGSAQHGTGEMIGEFPLYVPSVSVNSIGIGGGSIATVDTGSVLRVGPTSAGSSPGPACYGRGGTRPTLTDAMAVCGWLGHTDMAYGQIKIDKDLAMQAIAPIARTLGRSVKETAQAIIDIALSEMFVEVEKLASRDAVDIREFAMMPFGGGGPMLGALLAQHLGMRHVLVPQRPGVVSAMGGLIADMRGDFIRTILSPLSTNVLIKVTALFKELQDEGIAWLGAQGYHGPITMILSAEMRYRGQSYEIEVMLDDTLLKDIDLVAEAFHDTHQRLFDFTDRESDIEIVNLRLSALGETVRPRTQSHVSSKKDPPDPVLAPVFIGDRVRDLPLYHRNDLTPGIEFPGPAIVAQEDTTLAIPDACIAKVDEQLNIHLYLARAMH